MSFHDPNSPRSIVRRVDPKYFLIVLIPLIVFLTHEIIVGRFMAGDLDIPADILNGDQPWLEAAGRYRFLAATWFYTALTVLAVALVARTLIRPTALKTRAAALGTWAFVLTLALVPTAQNYGEPNAAHIYGRLGSAFFEAALSHGSLPGCAVADDVWLTGPCGYNPVITMFSRVMDFVNVLAGLGVGALIVGMILCLDKHEAEGIEEKAARLAENLTNAGATLFVRPDPDFWHVVCNKLDVLAAAIGFGT
ncbi:MAG: hypothetical protein AAGA74_00250 [Pseudomonadota bacterium]